MKVVMTCVERSGKELSCMPMLELRKESAE